MPFTCYYGLSVMEHLANVAAGLDSLVLGEAQILGQVSSAYQEAAEQHTLGSTLDALMRAAVRTGKRVRSETAIGANPASISSVAIALAQQTTGSLQGKRIVVIGLGKMGQMTIKALSARSLTQIAVANRSLAKWHTERGEVPEALPYMRQLAAALPDDPGARFNLALAAFRTGQKEEARRNFRAFLELAPDDPRGEEVRRLLARELR